MSPRISMESLPQRLQAQVQRQMTSGTVRPQTKAVALTLGDDKSENKTERRYRDYLDDRKQRGEIVDRSPHDAVTLKLANDTRYTPDYMVIALNGNVEFHEVKGFWRDDARVKIKVAARTFPWFRFVSVQWKAKEWVIEEFVP